MGSWRDPFSSQCEGLGTTPNITRTIIIVFTIATVKRKQICSGVDRMKSFFGNYVMYILRKLRLKLNRGVSRPARIGNKIKCLIVN